MLPVPSAEEPAALSLLQKGWVSAVMVASCLKSLAGEGLVTYSQGWIAKDILHQQKVADSSCIKYIVLSVFKGV